jgi:cytoskeletal protein CcmA (bactofilin family)
MKHGSGGVQEGGLSIIAPGMRVEGEIVTSGVVKVEGTVVGSINAEQQVLIAGGGRVEGDVKTREAIIGGAVQGAIFADERVEVQPSASVNGDITTFRLLIHEGGEVNGLLKMGQPGRVLEETGTG